MKIRLTWENIIWQKSCWNRITSNRKWNVKQHEESNKKKEREDKTNQEDKLQNVRPIHTLCISGEDGSVSRGSIFFFYLGLGISLPKFKYAMIFYQNVEESCIFQKMHDVEKTKFQAKNNRHI